MRRICTAMPTLIISFACLSGCGRFGPAELGAPLPTEGPPIQLLAPTFTPGCYTKEGREAFETGRSQVESAIRSILEFQASYTLQLAMQVSTQLLEDPTALSWSIAKDGRDGSTVHIEANSLARGEGWGHLSFFAYHDPGEGLRSGLDVSGEISYTPNSTTFDFGDRRFEIRRNLVRLDIDQGTLIRGHSADARVMFELLPIPRPEVGFHDTHLCWGPQFRPPTGADASEEHRTSYRLQCIQAIESARIPIPFEELLECER